MKDDTKEFYPFTFYKIGHSINPYKRENSFKPRRFKNLKVIAVFPYNIEFVLHREFDKYKIKEEKELFKKCKEIKKLVKLFNSFDNWKDYFNENINSEIKNHYIYKRIGEIKYIYENKICMLKNVIRRLRVRNYKKEKKEQKEIMPKKMSKKILEIPKKLSPEELKEMEELEEKNRKEERESEIKKTLEEWETIKPIFKEAVDIIIEKIKKDILSDFVYK